MSKLNKSQPESRFADGTLFVLPPLSVNFQKSNFLLRQTIAGLFAKSSVERWLFVTLTFADGLRSTRKAHCRLNSLLNKVRPRYGNYLWVLQPHYSGAIHYHVLVPVDFWTHDGTTLTPWRIRSDFSDEARLAAMSPQLRVESDWWTTMAPKYGFGRTQVAPIYSNSGAILKYLTRHDWRCRHWPFIETKSFQFWSCSKGLKAGTMRFAWHSKGSQLYRRDLEQYARHLGIHSYDDLLPTLGPHWSFYFRQLLGLQQT